MNLVVAVDQNWAIGKDGQLVIHNKYDLEHFKSLTFGERKAVILGSKTLKTFPNGQPLKGRINLVLTRDKAFAVNGATAFHSIKQLERFLKRKAGLKTKEKRISPDDVYVIGGASIYEQLYQQCKYAFVTHFDLAAKDPDAFFPNLAELPNWEIIEETPYVTYDGVRMRFVTYRNLDVA